MPRKKVKQGNNNNQIKQLESGGVTKMSMHVENVINDMLSTVTKDYVTVEPQIEQSVTISADEVTVMAQGSQNNENSNKITNAIKTTPAVEQSSVLEASTVMEKLQQLGLLSSIKKLVNADGLSATAIEDAAIAIHMLTHNLTRDQAVVVHNFDNKGVDLMQYVTAEYTPVQMYYIGTVLEEGKVPTVILDKRYSVSQMIELQEAVKRNIDVQKYADPDFTPSQLQALRKATLLGVDVTPMLAYKDLKWEQIDLLASLAYEGVAIEEILQEGKDTYTVDALRALLQEQKEARDAVDLRLTSDGRNLIK